jgi:hypothetical protein
MHKLRSAVEASPGKLPFADAEADFISNKGYGAFVDKLEEAAVRDNDFCRQSCG